MKEYRIIGAYTYPNLEHRVKGLLDKGWSLVPGGFAAIRGEQKGESNDIYMREMVREKSPQARDMCDRAECENASACFSARYGHICEECHDEIIEKGIDICDCAGIETFMASQKVKSKTPDYEEICGVAMPGVDVGESATYKPTGDVPRRFRSVTSRMEFATGEAPKLVFSGDPDDIGELRDFFDRERMKP